MDRSKLSLIVNTLSHLKLKQVYYRVYYLIKNKFFNRKYDTNPPSDLKQLIWKDSFLYQNTFLDKKTFLFLNLEHTFENEIDWNYSV